MMSGNRLVTCAEWYVDHDVLTAFARVMVDREAWDVETVLSFFEKPWKWTAEYEEWCALAALALGAQK